ncbi:MAG: hypothetical protein WBC92_16055 [Terracidiphilus sp.]
MPVSLQAAAQKLPERLIVLGYEYLHESLSLRAARSSSSANFLPLWRIG